MTRRSSRQSFVDLSKYDTLVAEAMLAFEQDVMYVITVAESARSISDKHMKAIQKSKA